MKRPEQEMRDDDRRHEDDGRRHVDPVNRSPVHTDPVNRSTVMDRDMSNDMGEYRHRFEQLQVQFIEEPKETVKKAEALVEEAVERMVSAMHDRVNRIHSELGDGTDDTERLRMAMRRYRELMDSFASNRAA